jgi:methylated-DNA-[protein]-cysteine S-methyltransferase
MTTFYTTITSPIGELLLTCRGGKLTGVYMERHTHGPASRAGWVRAESDELLQSASTQLRQYFSGERTEFDVPLAANGTAFQERVWAELRAIPYGRTISYGELARRIGNPAAARAVGLANGRNPISIIVPCHRVIGANGSLTGYGGGLERKNTLLAHERKVLENQP